MRVSAEPAGKHQTALFKGRFFQTPAEFLRKSKNITSNVNALFLQRCCFLHNYQFRKTSWSSSMPFSPARRRQLPEDQNQRFDRGRQHEKYRMKRSGFSANLMPPTGQRLLSGSFGDQTFEICRRNCPINT